jgi:hypothetical protein
LPFLSVEIYGLVSRYCSAIRADMFDLNPLTSTRRYHHYFKEAHNLSPGLLQCLEVMVGDDYMDRQVIETWRTNASFSDLQILELHSSIKQDALELLATSCNFPSLTTLVLSFLTRNMQRPQTREYFEIADRFLHSLPPLRTLKLAGDLSCLSVDSILEHHGIALRALWLSPSDGDKRLSPGDITRIELHCPLLEDLGLALRRSKGDATEVATYKALGFFRKLQDLSLTLDASNYDIFLEHALAGLEDDEEVPETPSDPSFVDEFDNQFVKSFCVENNFYAMAICGMLSSIPQ